MDEERTPTFEPMEWVVMITEIGGRLMQVETTLWFGDTERVVEYYVQPGDKKTRYQLYPESEIGYPAVHMIKCPTKEIAERCVKTLKAAYEEAQNKVREAERHKERVISQMEQVLRESVAREFAIIKRNADNPPAC